MAQDLTRASLTATGVEAQFSGYLRDDLHTQAQVVLN